MAAVVVQMITHDRVGGETLPVEVVAPVTVKGLVAAASKKFKAVSKQSRVYHGGTGAELTGNMPVEDLHGSFAIFSSKASWKGAEKLAAAHKAAEESRATDEAVAVPAAVPPPSTYPALLEAAKEARTDGVVLVWKETQDNGYLSNWASSPFIMNGSSYNTAEQWIMACKARACGDERILTQIMQSKSPRKQKTLGRSLNSRGVQRFWTLQAKWKAQLQGAGAKFQQNESLAVRLLRTGHKPIAEASPSDRIFGIGLAPSDPLAQDPENWRGQNLLGKALVRVREELRELVLSQALSFEGTLQLMLDAGGPGASDEADLEVQAVDLESEGSVEDEKEWAESEPEEVADMG